MNNEPVAWMLADKESEYIRSIMAVQHDFVPEGCVEIPLYTHPEKELHLSLQKSKETGELLAVTYTDDEHRIVEVLWKKPPAKTLTDEEILQVRKDLDWETDEWIDFARAILRKAQEK